MFLFIDTETTGTNTSSDRSVQIAWLLTDVSGREVKRSNQIIYPEGFTIPQGAERIHGIGTARALEIGVPIKRALKDLKEALSETELIICHNVQFDLAILENDAAAVGIDLGLAHMKRLCTMRATTHWCRIPQFSGKSGFKWPKLEELHRRCFGRAFENAHDALADVVATKDCFFYLLEKNVIEIPTISTHSRQNMSRATVGSSAKVEANNFDWNIRKSNSAGDRPPKVQKEYRIEKLGRKDSLDDTKPEKKYKSNQIDSNNSGRPSVVLDKYRIEKIRKRHDR